MMALENIFYIQLFSSLFMTGLIWFVQIVHYPLFAYIEPNCFPDYAKKHQWLTSWVVGPIMLTEVFSALVLCLKHEKFLLNILILICIWLSTACLQIPVHGQLIHSYDLENIRSLVRGNWVRTVLWSLKSFILLFSMVDFV